MSVIVWDGKTLAADRQATNHNLRLTSTKIWKHEDKLLAGYGDKWASEAMRNWVVKGMDPAEFPKFEKEDCGGFWVITKAGILRFESKPYPLVFHDEKIADGSGRDFALGAMAMGANAIKAVEVASKYDVYCGGGVDWLTLDD